MSDGLIAERFRLRKLRGSGGTAAVFEADDTRHGRRVAVKLLHPHLAVGPVAWEAFFEEVRAAQAIAHPNIAEVYDAGLAPGDPPVAWIAMELVEGVTLADHVRERGPLTIADAVAVFAAVLDATGAAHAGGVVHRDITPSNIMLTSSASADADGTVSGIRLLDFGLADVPGRTTRGADPLLSGAASEASNAGVVASVPYASPEQLLGEAVGEASDIYQIGATLFFALTGRSPFEGETAAIVRAHLSAPPPVPSARRRGIPPALDRLVTTAMLKRQQDRYTDAAAMRAALDAVIDVGPGEARTTSPTVATRVYRTRLPGGDVPTGGSGLPLAATPGPSPARFSHTRGAWRAPLIAAGLIAAVTAAAGWSAMAASTPENPIATAGAAVTGTATSAPSASPADTAAVSARRAVPDVRGLTVDEAVSTVERAGLTVGDIGRDDGPAVRDTVLASVPAAGNEVHAGAVIALRAASGLNTVPVVTGMVPAEAQGALTTAGFSSRVAVGGFGVPGVVAETAPGSGQVAAVGSVVVLRIPPEASATPSASASPTLTPLPSSTPTDMPPATEPPRP
ncbi:Serine/threonine-protein kinase PknB [Microbacterium laevaniformans]|uniref:Serine/threonine-protein kinase PknB n=1 Tax=Microbacterium laevaniformans TaxID=36807 RepID=A0A150HFS8_9MICO|nr:protein kinase [Microbacterium laevaniformans]KXZ60962.1 Serine/threonine-protein kinase PknB [Microbacterium laevaniformans]